PPFCPERLYRLFGKGTAGTHKIGLRRTGQAADHSKVSGLAGNKSQSFAKALCQLLQKRYFWAKFTVDLKSLFFFIPMFWTLGGLAQQSAKDSVQDRRINIVYGGTFT